MNSSAGRTARAVIGVVLAVAVVMLFSLDMPDTLEVFLRHRHRSGWTHSALAPLLVYFIAALDRQAVIRRFISMGVSLGVAIHLSFDLFPKSWQGFALVNLHGLGTLGIEWARIWLALGLFVSVLLMVLAASSLRGRALHKVAALFSTLGSAFFFFITYSRQEDPFLGPAAAFITCWFVATRLSRLGRRNATPTDLTS